MVTEGEFLSAEEVEKTGDLMINKFEAYHKKKNAFLTLSELDLNSICTIYESLGRNGEMTSLMDLEFLSDPTFFRKVIRIFAPTVFSTASDEPLKGVFSAENYSLLSQFVDTNMLYLKSVKAIGKLTTDEERAFPLGTALTDTDLIYLFQLWHEAALKLNIVDDLAEDNS